MLVMKIALGSLLLLGVSVSNAAETVFSVHGSGTTNPSKCYWAVMERMRAQSKLPIHLTYRAVGSTTGQLEFVNDLQNSSVADFGSGDLPMDADRFSQLNDVGIEMIHLPVLLGAVSFFHSVPGVEKLNLTSCLLARIFSRDITSWDDPDILLKNPALQTSPTGLDITVVHRVKGSSSTDGVTNYLHGACGDIWPADKVGANITWDEETLGCEGSGGVTECINENEGAIGYIDAGHGINADLSEIELENQDGFLLSSEEASANGGIAAAEGNVFPLSFDEDFSNVSLLNQPGEFTWPIVLATYIYVRKELTSIEDPNEKTLLKAFLRALYTEEFNEVCVEDFGFTLPTETIRERALSAIDTLLEADGAGTPWTFEQDTEAIIGAADFVISSKRDSILDIQLQEVRGDAVELEEMLRKLNTELATARSETESLRERLAEAEGEVTQVKVDMVSSQAEYGGGDFTESDEQQLRAALVLSSLTFVFWMAWFVMRIFGWITKS